VSLQCLCSLLALYNSRSVPSFTVKQSLPERSDVIVSSLLSTSSTNSTVLNTFIVPNDNVYNYIDISGERPWPSYLLLVSGNREIVQSLISNNDGQTTDRRPFNDDEQLRRCTRGCCHTIPNSCRLYIQSAGALVVAEILERSGSIRSKPGTGELGTLLWSLRSTNSKFV